MLDERSVTCSTQTRLSHSDVDSQMRLNSSRNGSTGTL